MTSSTEVVPILANFDTINLHRLSPAGVPKDIINDLKTFLEEVLHTTELNSNTIILIVTKLMQQIGKYKQLSGSDKKNCVIYVINNCIDTSEILSADQMLKSALKSIIPHTIDMLIDVAKGHYKFKGLHSKIKSWFKCC